MNFIVGIEGTYGCDDFRGELRIHIILHMIRVVRIADIRIVNV